MEKLTRDLDIVKIIRGKGYIVNLYPRTEVFEPLKSLVDDKIQLKEIFMSTKERNLTSLIEFNENLK